MLFELLQVDGKEKILPILRQNEATQQQMQQLAAENEQLNAGLQNMQSLNQKYAKAMKGAPAVAGQPPGAQEQQVPQQGAPQGVF